MDTRATLKASLLVAIVGAFGTVSLAGQSFEIAVKKDQIFGASRGTLTFDADRVEYITDDEDDRRRWTYTDIKQVQILSTQTITIETYEDQGRLRFGADRAFEFELLEGDVRPELVEFLLDRIARPVVTAVMPRAPGEVVMRVPVKHVRRGRGSHGALVLYDDGLAYVTETDGAARYWRFGDLPLVLPLGRYRLQILAYEGGGARTRRFTFDLKGDLPEGFTEAVWQSLHGPDG